MPICCDRARVLVDPADDGLDPWLMFLLTHEVKSGDGQVLSKRLQFVRVNPNGSTTFAGWAPHLDLEPLADSERTLIKDVLNAPWIRADQEQRAIALAASTLVPEHFRKYPIAGLPMSTRRSLPFTTDSARKSRSGPTDGSN